MSNGTSNGEKLLFTMELSVEEGWLEWKKAYSIPGSGEKTARIMILFEAEAETMGKEKINCSQHYSKTNACDHRVEDIPDVIVAPAITRKQSNGFKIRASNFEPAFCITYEY